MKICIEFSKKKLILNGFFTKLKFLFLILCTNMFLMMQQKKFHLKLIYKSKFNHYRFLKAKMAFGDFK